jgi:16S rRNA (guanine(966)-N(2))-methyltransferase RsmD
LTFSGFGGIFVLSPKKESMRVIAGKYKGRRLRCPPGLSVRPTGDSVKETLFGLLAGSVEGASVVDLFGGVGALGIEALSRGARSSLFVEVDAVALKYLAQNLEAVGAAGDSEVMKGDVFKCARRLSDGGRRFDIVFADPPYGRGYVIRLFETLQGAPLAESGGVFVLQHHRREPAGAVGAGLEMYKRREFGDTVVSMFRAI